MKKNQKINKEMKKSKIIEIEVKREKGNKSKKKHGKSRCNIHKKLNS